MFCVLKWWIITIKQKCNAFVTATKQTNYHYAMQVILYKPICHTVEASYAIWFTLKVHNESLIFFRRYKTITTSLHSGTSDKYFVFLKRQINKNSASLVHFQENLGSRCTSIGTKYTETFYISHKSQQLPHYC